MELIKHQLKLDVAETLLLGHLVEDQGRENGADQLVIVNSLDLARHDTSVRTLQLLALSEELEAVEAFLIQISQVVQLGLLVHCLDVLLDKHVPVQSFEHFLIDTLHSETICELYLDLLTFGLKSISL